MVISFPFPISSLSLSLLVEYIIHFLSFVLLPIIPSQIISSISPLSLSLCHNIICFNKATPTQLFLFLFLFLSGFCLIDFFSFDGDCCQNINGQELKVPLFSSFLLLSFFLFNFCETCLPSTSEFSKFLLNFHLNFRTFSPIFLTVYLKLTVQRSYQAKIPPLLCQISGILSGTLLLNQLLLFFSFLYPPLYFSCNGLYFVYRLLQYNLCLKIVVLPLQFYVTG